MLPWTMAGAALAVSACITLTPIRAQRVVELRPRGGDPTYQIDQIDSSVVYVREGLRVRVRHLSDPELTAELPGGDNPYTYLGEVDPSRGHVPVRFTVFQVTVNNPTFDKVLLPPEDATLITDRGRVMRTYELTRAEAQGDPLNFETYWLSRGVQSGNQQKLYLNRMGTLRGTIYHRDSPVFKGNSYSGKLVFEPLPPGTRSATLHIEDFVLEFGLYDVPETVIDLDFGFSVRDQILNPEGAGERPPDSAAKDRSTTMMVARTEPRQQDGLVGKEVTLGRP